MMATKWQHEISVGIQLVRQLTEKTTLESTYFFSHNEK